MSVPTSYGHYRLRPLLARFPRQYPQVQVELNITNRNVDLVAEGFDLAIRLGQMPDSGLVARKPEDAGLLLVASPDYLRQMGTPQTLEELQRHVCLPFVMPRTGRRAPWVFRDAGREVDWLPVSYIETSDDVLGVVSLAEQGIGICQSYEFIVHQADTTRAVSRGAATTAWALPTFLRYLCPPSTPIDSHAGYD